MKFTILFFLPFFICTHSVLGDNWELFPSNQVTYFHFKNDWIDAISPFYVDHVETHNEADYQYILRNYVEELSGGCYESLQTDSLIIHLQQYNFRLPNEVIVYQNGWYGETVFEPNPSNLPTLIFHAQAEVGDSWFIESEDYQDFNRLLITCNSIEEESFLDLVDNVKTFRVQALQDNDAVNSPFNNIIFKVSEKYGLLQGIPLRELLQNEPTINMQLKGLEDESGNLHGRGAYTILDFVPEYSVGDILKWKYRDSGLEWNESILHRDSVMNVSITPTSVGYTYDRVTYNEVTEEEEILHNQEKSYDISSFETPLELLYYEIAIGEQKNISRIHYHLFPPFSYSLNLSENRYLNIKGGATTILEECSVGASTALTNPNSYYHPDLGVIRYSTVVNATTNLIGYKIGDKQGGDISPIGSDAIIDNIAPHSYFANQITLHPNPTHDRFTLQLQNPNRQNLTLEVTDIHGRTVLSREILEDSIEMDLSDSSNGIYLVQLSDGKHWWTEKVVKY